MEATELKINEWKKKYKTIFEITIKDEEGKEYKAYFRKPDLKVLSVASKFAESDPLKSSLIVFDNCLLECDEEIKTDDELKLSVLTQLGGLFKVYQATIKKL